jgi:hypothetical protein
MWWNSMSQGGGNHLQLHFDLIKGWNTGEEREKGSLSYELVKFGN